MAYSELIKNFARIREYMRNFYLYGFRSRGEYDQKSTRSYDNERRRIENYVGDYLSFRQTENGRIVFMSVDSRNMEENPLYRAFKSKSFTDADITLHFYLLDILADSEEMLAMPDILNRLDQRMERFASPMSFDESTIRNKLKEYRALGIVESEKQGKQTMYQLAWSPRITQLADVLEFFSEAAPLGVVGSYLLDRLPDRDRRFFFKHHYITQALDSEILFRLFDAISQKRAVTVVPSENVTENRGYAAAEQHLVPLKIYIGAQSGRQYLMAYDKDHQRLVSRRLDFIAEVIMGDEALDFGLRRKMLDDASAHMWGVTCSQRGGQTNRVEFTIFVDDQEQYILNRLMRECRCGRVYPLDANHYHFTADVYDAQEMIPWIRTYICRITDLHISYRQLENQFRADLQEMYQLYNIGEEESKYDFS